MSSVKVAQNSPEVCSPRAWWTRCTSSLLPYYSVPRGRPGAVDWAGPESPSDAPRIENPRWELCGADAYVSGSLVYPKRMTRS